MKFLSVVAALTALGAFSVSISPTLAQAPNVNAGSVNIFRDFRGINDVGITAGDELQFGANIAGGSAGVTIQGIFTSNTGPAGSFTTSNRVCGPLVVNPNFCATAVGFSAARL